MSGFGTDVGHQLVVGVGQADALARRTGIDGLRSLQANQRLRVAVVRRRRTGQVHGEGFARLRRAANGGLHREGFLHVRRDAGVQYRVAAGIDDADFQVQRVRLTGNDSAAADEAALGIDKFVRLAATGDVTKHQFDRRRVFQRRLHVSLGSRVVDIDFGAERRLGVIAQTVGAGHTGQRTGRSNFLRIGEHRLDARGRIAGRRHLKLSPALNAPPLSARVKPSITGGGLVVVLKVPRSVPSERLTE